MKNKERLEDFSPKELPETRWALFWDLLFHQSGTLISTSLLLALFALPLFSDYFVFSFLGSSLQASGGAKEGLFSLVFYGTAIALPCFMVLFLGLSGASEVTKRLSFLEGTLGVASFFEGLKKNWRSGLLTGLLYGLSFGLALLGCLYLLLFQGALPVLTGLGIGLLLFQFIIVNSLCHYLLSQEALYLNSFGATLKNAFIFAHIKLPLNFVWSLLSPGLVIALFLINSVTSYVGIGLYVLFSAYGLLVWTLYANAVYDRHINATYYPELMGKGLHKKEG